MRCRMIQQKRGTRTAVVLQDEVCGLWGLARDHTLRRSEEIKRKIDLMRSGVEDHAVAGVFLGRVGANEVRPQRLADLSSAKTLLHSLNARMQAQIVAHHDDKGLVVGCLQQLR